MHPTFREDINQTKWSIKTCGNSSVGRARPCQGRGREFESRFPLQILKLIVNVTFSEREKRAPLWARDRVSASRRISFPALNFQSKL